MSTRLRKWRPCIIVWKDAVTIHEQSNSDDDFPIAERRTIGFFIRKTKEYITVAMEDDRGLKAGATDCQTVTSIPLSLVVKTTSLKSMESVHETVVERRGHPAELGAELPHSG